MKKRKSYPEQHLQVGNTNTINIQKMSLEIAIALAQLFVSILMLLKEDNKDWFIYDLDRDEN